LSVSLLASILYLIKRNYYQNGIDR